MKMLSWLWQVVQRINYYSASRAQSKWTRASTWAMVLCLLMALPATFVADRIVHTMEVRQMRQGEFLTESGGRSIEDATAVSVTTNNFRNVRTAAKGMIIGRWTVMEHRLSSGFPLTTSIAERIRLDVDMFAEPNPREEISISPETRALISDGFVNAGERELAEVVRDAGQPTKRLVWAWVGNSMLWLMALALVAWLAVFVARSMAHVFRVRRAVRAFRFRIEGKCAHCGYDLAGLEFSARCPECGALAQ